MSQGQANPNFTISGSSKNIPMLSPLYGLADEGSLFVSTLAATASTAVACTTQALADTNPAIGIFNGQSAGGYNIYPLCLKMKVTVVGGSNTSKNYSAIVEQASGKLTTTGTAMGTPVNVNTGSSVLSKATLNAGVLVAAAAGPTLRRVGDGQIVGAVEVAFDEWIFTFGEAANKNLIGTATLVSARTVPLPPVVLAPGWIFTLGVWGASQAAAADTFGFELWYAERPSGQ